MGWPLRLFQEEGSSFVTSRCFQGRRLLRPSVHLRLQSLPLVGVGTRGRARRLQQYLRANLSTKVGKWVDWSGGFWERRYSAELVLDDAALVGMSVRPP